MIYIGIYFFLVACMLDHFCSRHIWNRIYVFLLPQFGSLEFILIILMHIKSNPKMIPGNFFTHSLLCSTNWLMMLFLVHTYRGMWCMWKNYWIIPLYQLRYEYYIFLWDVIPLLEKVYGLLLRVVVVITSDNIEIITSGRRPRVINSILHKWLP